MPVRAIKSAERTLALFELLSSREGRLTVGETATSLGIPQTSASMLLRHLQQLGYLDYDARSRKFGATIRVMLVGSWINKRFRNPGDLVGALEALQAAIDGETVSLGIQNGGAVQYVAAIEAEWPDRLRLRAGEIRTLTTSAAGRALLSLESDATVSGWVRRCNAEAQETRLRVNEFAFLELMAQVRAQGFAETMGDSIPGISAIAVVMPSPLDGQPLAVAAGGPIDRIQAKRARIISALLEVKARYVAACPSR